MTELETYARKILADHGCDIYTYGGEWSKYILDDLKKEYPDGMEFPYVDVANAILEISRAKPIERKPWQVVWSTEDCTDGYGCDSFDEANDSALDTLATWQAEKIAEFKDCFNPTEEEIDDYDYMIANFYVKVYKYNPNTDEYEEYWEPSYEDEKSVGWVYWEELEIPKEDM